MASSNSDSSDTADLLSKNGNTDGNDSSRGQSGQHAAGAATATVTANARPGSAAGTNASVDAIASQIAGLLAQQSHQYTNYNYTILLSLRPSVAADTAPDASSPSLHAHLADYHDFQGSDEDDRPLQPHVYELATKAYYYLRRTGQDQGIVFNSACNTAWTGQAEHRRLATRALLSLSSNNTSVDPATGSSFSKSHKFAKQIQAAEFIIDAFGCVGGETDSLPSPRFGRYAELQFSDKGRIQGYKTILYNLDLDTGKISFNLNGAAVNGIQIRERAFNAVRWLAAGASPNERSHLRLPEPSQIGMDKDQYDRERFGLLKQALKGFGFPKKAVASLCSTLAAILHISTLEFVPATSSDSDAGCSISNTEVLHIVASQLGLLDNGTTAEANLLRLEEAFTRKTAYIDGEKCTVVLDVEKANEYKERVAKSLYRLLWEWLGEFVNQRLCKEDFAGMIALVDFPALANSPGHRNEGNTLSTLCNNFTSERISAFVTTHLFPQSTYTAQKNDGLPLAAICKQLEPPNTVSETIRVFENTPGGLIHIIDDQSVRKGKNERTMLDAMGKRWGKNRQFTFRKESSDSTRAGTFTVEHWSDAENITYSTEDFLEKNLNIVPSDLVELLGGKAVPLAGGRRARRNAKDSSNDASDMSIIGGSGNSFVRELFANEVLAAARDEKATMSKSRSGNTGPETDSEGEGAENKLGVPGARIARKPSVRRKGTISKKEDDHTTAGTGGLTRTKTIGAKRAELLSRRCVLGNLNTSLNDVFETLSGSCRLFFVLCLAPNTAGQQGIDARLIKSQVRALGLQQIRERCLAANSGGWMTDMEFKDFWDRYNVVERWQGDLVKRVASMMWNQKMTEIKEEMEWSDEEFGIGKSKVFLSHGVFRQMEDYLRSADQDELKRKREFTARSEQPDPDPYSPFSRPAILLDVASPMVDEVSPFNAPHLPYNHPAFAESASTAALPLVAPDPFGMEDDRRTFMTDDDFSKSRLDLEEGGSTSPGYGQHELEKGEKGLGLDAAGIAGEKETVEVYKETRSRKQWKFLVWCFTWWIPSFLLIWPGKMKRPDVRMAWREKVTIFMLISLLCGLVVFVVAILGNLMCPREYVYGSAELASHSYSNNQDNMLVSIRGEVFDLTNFANVHYPSVVPLRSVQKYGGVDASNLFPVQVNALCNGKDGFISPWVTLDTNNVTDPNSGYHDFRAFTNDSRPDWYWEQMVYLRYNFRRGFMGYTKGAVSKRSRDALTRNSVIYRGNVYDMTGYINNDGGGLRSPAGTQPPADTDRQFMHDQIVSIFKTYAGSDITKQLDSLRLNPDVMAAQRVCLRNLFFVGKVDTRNSIQCQFSRYILLAFSIIMVAIVGFKFIAALQFGRARQPENHDRFVICQVPCYTEGEDSLKDCFESLASLKYDDKRKLLFVICDGMIIGSGNDRPTPRIVLDLLGADPALDPEPLSFLSLGEGSKQHNMGKVYSGLYEHAGHVIPYIVLVKVGKPSERSRPGNRGKRDSQMLLMRFFNRVHFDSPMSPCELEIYHQIKNVIGVNPTFYEFLLAIDADTVVDPLSLNRFVSVMNHDRKVLATCGETELSNAKRSLISMMQVYEYFISHHLSKAFESLFGSVTCLPGCFTMYRLRSVENKPLFIANDIVDAFGENRVDTLHMKNLLHLGEDRYLTTLLLKNFPSYKLTFTKDAHARTIAPEEWKVLLSQRRRWINSTIHNLAELIGRVDRLCGFCCCSMRAIVLIDLLSTLIQPVTVAYIVYLVYLVAGEGQPVPTTALIMLGAIYGLQAIIFLLHRKFEMIVWMLIYILAIPIFSFLLPIYSFWKQDDFSWGQTRVVLGEKGKKLVIHDEGVFKSSDIPLKSWHDYENELWERGSNASIGQLLAEKQEMSFAGGAYGNKGYGGEGSIYGHESVMNFNSRPRTPMSEIGARSFHQALNSYSGAHTPLPGSMTPGGGIMGYASSRAGSVHHGNMGSYDSAAYGGAGLAGYAYPPGGATQGYEMQGQNPFQPQMPAGAMPQHQYNHSRQSFGSMSAFMAARSPPGMMPSDEQLEMDIRNILARADLQTLTKKGVREELEKLYGIELSSKKAFINGQIEQALSNLY